MTARGVVSGASSLLTGLQVYYALSDVTDSTGGGLTLTNNNGVTFSAGKVGNAADFVSTSNQYLFRADGAAFQRGTGDLSISCWTKFTTSTSNEIITGYGAFATSGYGFFTNGGGITGYMCDGVLQKSCGAINLWNDGNWHMITLTCSRTGNMQMYVGLSTEGAAVDISAASASVNNANGFTFGARYVPDSYFDGSVDEFGLWNRVLTFAEITSLYNSGNGTTYPF